MAVDTARVENARWPVPDCLHHAREHRMKIVSSNTASDCLRSKPPAHLSDEVCAWWRSVVHDYQLEPHHLRLLQAACEAWDRSQQARKAVEREGLTFKDSNGNLKANPAVAIERDARTLFARLVRELDLDEGAADHRRPPAIASNRRGG